MPDIDREDQPDSKRNYSLFTRLFSLESLTTEPDLSLRFHRMQEGDDPWLAFSLEGISLNEAKDLCDEEMIKDEDNIEDAIMTEPPKDYESSMVDSAYGSQATSFFSNDLLSDSFQTLGDDDKEVQLDGSNESESVLEERNEGDKGVHLDGSNESKGVLEDEGVHLDGFNESEINEGDRGAHLDGTNENEAVRLNESNESKAVRLDDSQKAEETVKEDDHKVESKDLQIDTLDESSFNSSQLLSSTQMFHSPSLLSSTQLESEAERTALPQIISCITIPPPLSSNEHDECIDSSDFIEPLQRSELPAHLKKALDIEIGQSALLEETLRPLNITFTDRRSSMDNESGIGSSGEKKKNTFYDAVNNRIVGDLKLNLMDPKEGSAKTPSQLTEREQSLLCPTVVLNDIYSFIIAGVPPNNKFNVLGRFSSCDSRSPSPMASSLPPLPLSAFNSIIINNVVPVLKPRKILVSVFKVFKHGFLKSGLLVDLGFSFLVCASACACIFLKICFG